MLERLRQSVAGTLAKILIGLLVVSFALWGIGDVFSPSQNPPIATIGGEDISSAKFMRAFQQRYLQVRQNFLLSRRGDISVEEARAAGLDVEVVGILLSQTILEQTASKLGLAVGSDELIGSIQRDLNFQGAFSQFDPVIFKNVLEASQLSEEAYLDALEGQITRDQLFTLFTRRPPPPRLALEEFLLAQNERRVAEYVILKGDKKLKLKAPDDETLEAYMDKNPAPFTTAEKKRFEVLLLSPKAFTRKVKISDKDLRAAYRERKADFEKPEQRLVEQLVYSTSDEAAKAYLKRRNFLALAKAQGLTKEDILLGWLTPDQYISPKLKTASLALATGKVSRPIETDLGWVLLRVKEVKEGKKTPFSKVKAKLKEELAYNQVQDEIDELHDLIEDEVASGEPFTDLAKKYTLHHVKSTELTRGDDLPKNLAKVDGLADRIWLAEQEGALEVQSTPKGGYYWLTINAITPAVRQPLVDVRKLAVKLWATEQRTIKLKERAEDISKQVLAGKSLSEVAKIKSQLTPPLSRVAADQMLSPILLDALFTTPKGGVFHGLGRGNQVMIARVASVVQAKSSAAARRALRARVNRDLANLSTNETLRLYLTHHERALGVSILTNNLDLAFERQPPQAR